MRAVGRDGGGGTGGRVAEGRRDQGDAVDLGGLEGEGVDGVGVAGDVAVGGGEEDLLAGVSGLGEFVLQDLQSPDGFGAGDGEGVGQLDARGADDAAEGRRVSPRTLLSPGTVEAS